MVSNASTAANTALWGVADAAVNLPHPQLRTAAGSTATPAGKDAALLGHGVHFRESAGRYDSAASSVSNATSFAQARHAYLEKVSRVLYRMGELAASVQDSKSYEADRAAADSEFKELASYVTDVAGRSFNGVPLFGGGSQKVAAADPSTQFELPAIELPASEFAALSEAGLAAADAAYATLRSVHAAIDRLESNRAASTESLERLHQANDELAARRDAAMAAVAPIHCSTMAVQAIQVARFNIIMQNDNAMLVQANTSPPALLQLFR